ncbi:MAG TPA: hypothetical protein VHK91_11800 [Flavisolibacter sp.]|jgi:hypothetical protein|nr:hypothetical protein [Flavisolibacter sp.]
MKQVLIWIGMILMLVILMARFPEVLALCLVISVFMVFVIGPPSFKEK